MNKAVFLDRDGILNVEIGRYVYDLTEFKIVEGIVPLLQHLKSKGYYLIVVTNQAGIAKGIYGHEDVEQLHSYFQKESGDLIDHFYYSPYHPEYNSHSFGRKPGTLLFEKGIAKYNLDPSKCWMIGDKERDIIPAKKLKLKTIRVFLEGFYEEGEETIADYYFRSVLDINNEIFNEG